jgi:hypothetical protein
MHNLYCNIESDLKSTAYHQYNPRLLLKGSERNMQQMNNTLKNDVLKPYFNIRTFF